MKINEYQKGRDTPSGFHAMRDHWPCDNISDSNMLVLKAWTLKIDPKHSGKELLIGVFTSSLWGSLVSYTSLINNPTDPSKKNYLKH